MAFELPEHFRLLQTPLTQANVINNSDELLVHSFECLLVAYDYYKKDSLKNPVAFKIIKDQKATLEKILEIRLVQLEDIA